MAFLDRILEQPSYGYSRDGQLYVPSSWELLREFAGRVNPLRSRKNWLAFICWAATLLLFVPLAFFLTLYFSLPLLLLGFVYSMVGLGSHGTLWFHRYATHRAYSFRGPLARFLVRNLVIKIIPDELYVLSHHVHHQRSEQPGDPYNVHGGWLYCFLADVNHQAVSRSLSEADYARVCRLMEPSGVRPNSYQQYLRWGSVCRPGRTLAHYALNWAFWYAVLFTVGGHALATALFGMSALWAVGIRTFNFQGHGGGRDLRRDGVDFNRADLSVNQLWPGFVAGEWHNNHHLYPHSARSGFLAYQLDLPWLFIRAGVALGLIHSYKDFKADFLRRHLEPWRNRHAGNIECRATVE